jgi:hypothetical protein
MALSCGEEKLWWEMMKQEGVETRNQTRRVARAGGRVRSGVRGATAASGRARLRVLRAAKVKMKEDKAGGMSGGEGRG